MAELSKAFLDKLGEAIKDGALSMYLHEQMKSDVNLMEPAVRRERGADSFRFEWSGKDTELSFTADGKQITFALPVHGHSKGRVSDEIIDQLKSSLKDAKFDEKDLAALKKSGGTVEVNGNTASVNFASNDLTVTAPTR